MKDKEKMPVAIYQVDCGNYDKTPFADIVDDIIGKINRKNPNIRGNLRPFPSRKRAMK